MAQVEVEKTYTPAELNEVSDYLTLLGSMAYKCESSDDKKQCEKNLLFDKATDEIHIFLSDGRDKKSGMMDINEVLRNPSSYGGEKTTLNLADIFDNHVHPFKSVQARFVEENKILINVTYDSKDYEKEVLL